MPELDTRLGGSKTSLTASYTWGQQGLETRFRDVYQPGQGIFSPGYPLAPLDPQRVRVWDYPVGVNTIYTPRSYEAISFEELRRLADAHDITRLAIETRKDQLERLDWAIRVKGARTARPDAASRVAAVAEFWRRPDGERPFATWLRALLEDLLVLDAPALELRRNRGGALIGLDIVDGATVKVLVDETGRRPRPPAPAYEQVIKGRPWKLLTADELLYQPRNPRPHKAYGFGPVEQIVMTVNIALRRQVMQLQHFTEGNVPPGLLNAPDGWNVEQITQFQEWFDSALAGNTASRTRLVWGPSGARYQAFKEAPYKDDFDEWLARIVCYAFSLPPTAFIRQMNRATAESSQDTAATEGLAPLMLWVKRLADHVTQDLLGHPDLEFAWGDLTPADPAAQAKIIDTYVRDGVYAVNEARGLLGLDPVPGGDQPMIYGTQGAVPLGAGAVKVASGAALYKYNPDEPRIPAGQSGGGEWTTGEGGSENVADSARDRKNECIAKCVLPSRSAASLPVEQPQRVRLSPLRERMYAGGTVEEVKLDRDLARHVVAVGFHSLSLLESLIPILKEHCDQDEYTEYLRSIGAVSAEMSTELFSKVFQEHPDLEREVESKIKQYGQFF